MGVVDYQSIVKKRCQEFYPWKCCETIVTSGMVNRMLNRNNEATGRSCYLHSRCHTRNRQDESIIVRQEFR